VCECVCVCFVRRVCACVWCVNVCVRRAYSCTFVGVYEQITRTNIILTIIITIIIIKRTNLLIINHNAYSPALRLCPSIPNMVFKDNHQYYSAQLEAYNSRFYFRHLLPSHNPIFLHGEHTYTHTYICTHTHTCTYHTHVPLLFALFVHIVISLSSFNTRA